MVVRTIGVYRILGRVRMGRRNWVLSWDRSVRRLERRTGAGSSIRRFRLSIRRFLRS
jgi:hypothetical protein